MNHKEAVRQVLSQLRELLTDLNRWMAEHPEAGFQEYETSKRLTGILEDEGFEVMRNVAGMETAFVARYGDQGKRPAIALIAEYDGVPGRGQVAGHNIVSVSAIGAALSLIRIMPELPGSLYVIGTPAHEPSPAVNDRGGKVYMVDAGVFEEMDAVLMFHADTYDSAYSHMLAAQPLEMAFRRSSAFLGNERLPPTQAFETAALAHACIGVIRHFLPPGHQVHGFISEAEGTPGKPSDPSCLRLQIFAPSDRALEPFTEKIVQCGEAAAMVTDAQLELDYYLPRFKEMINSSVLARLLESNLRSLGRQPETRPRLAEVSSDTGNVSHEVPTVHAHIAVGPLEQVGGYDTDQFARATLEDAGEKAFLDAAAALAMTVIDLYRNPHLLEEAWENLYRQREVLDQASRD